MELVTKSINVSKRSEIGFVEGTEWVYFQKDGRVAVVNAEEGIVLGEFGIPEHCLSFFVARAEDDQSLKCVYICDTQIKVEHLGGVRSDKNGQKEENVQLSETPLASAYVASKKQVWILGASKLITFDLKTLKVAHTRDNKHKFTDFAVHDDHLLLFSKNKYQLSFLERHLSTNAIDFSDNILSATLKPDQTNDTCIVALGCASGKVHLLKYQSSGELAFKTFKKWHKSDVSMVTFNPETSVLYSAGPEDVIMFWDFQTNRTDFLPRFTDKVQQFKLSDNTANFVVRLMNGYTAVFRSQSFELLFQNYGASDRIFESNFEFHFDSGIATLNQQLKLSLYKVSLENGYALSGRQANVTERNIVSSVNEGSQYSYKVDAVGFSPDGLLLVSAESLSFKNEIVFSRIRVFVVKNNGLTFENMHTIESPHGDEKVTAIHFLFEQRTNSDFISELHSQRRLQKRQILGSFIRGRGHQKPTGKLTRSGLKSTLLTSR